MEFIGVCWGQLGSIGVSGCPLGFFGGSVRGLCVCPCSAVKCSIVYYGSMFYILCVCLSKT